MRRAPPVQVGQLLVAVVFGPLMGVAMWMSSVPAAPWMVGLALVNVGVAVGVWLVPSPAWGELGAGWLVMTSLAGVLMLA